MKAASTCAFQLDSISYPLLVPSAQLHYRPSMLRATTVCVPLQLRTPFYHPLISRAPLQLHPSVRGPLLREYLRIQFRLEIILIKNRFKNI